MWKHIRNLVLIFIVLGAIGIWYLSRPDVATVSLDAVSGTKPAIGAPREQISRPSKSLMSIGGNRVRSQLWRLG